MRSWEAVSRFLRQIPIIRRIDCADRAASAAIPEVFAGLPVRFESSAVYQGLA